MSATCCPENVHPYNAPKRKFRSFRNFCCSLARAIYCMQISKKYSSFSKIFCRCRKRLQSAVRGVIIQKESGSVAGDDPAAERGASPHEWVTVRPAKAGQVRYAERCTEALPSPEPKRVRRQARSVFGRAFFARRYRLMLCLHKA